MKVTIKGEDLLGMKTTQYPDKDGLIKQFDFEDVDYCSDGYHTIEELYEHRIRLFIALCKELKGTKKIWRSKKHSDGTSFDGWFIMGIGQQIGEQITYHLPISVWEATNFAETYDEAYEWDGHTSNDVLERIKRL